MKRSMSKTRAVLGLVLAGSITPACGGEDDTRSGPGAGGTNALSGGSPGATGATAGAGGTPHSSGGSSGASGKSSTSGGDTGTDGGYGSGHAGAGGDSDAEDGEAGASGDVGAPSSAGGPGAGAGGATDGGTANSEGGAGDPNGGTANGGTGNGGTSGSGAIDESSLGLPETIEPGACGECPIGLTCGGGGDEATCGTVKALPNGKVCSVDGFCFKHPLPQNNSLRDAFARNEVIWAVGDRGTVLRYDGQSWSGLTNLVYTTNSFDLATVWVGAAGDVWIGGAGGLLLHGVGSSWNQVRIPTAVIPAADTISAIGGSSASDIWIGTGQGRLVHFDGENFVLEKTYASELTDIEVVAANDIYLTGAHGVARYDGDEWTLENGSFSTIQAIAARTPTDIWAVGTNANIYRKLAGTWQTHDRVGTNSYTGVIPRGANDVWVVGHEFVHFDGLTWTASAAPTYFLAASGTVGGAAVAVGQNGATAHFDGGNPVIINDGEKQYWDTASVMHGYSNTDFWIAGQDRSSDLSKDYSLLLHYDGTSFTRINASSASWIALWVERNGGVRVAPGAGSTARYYLPPEGTSVQSQPTGASTVLRRVFYGMADDALWAAGRGFMEYWNGQAWTTVPHPFAGSSTTYTAMWGSAADDLWAVTDTATAAYYDGESWEPVALPGNVSGISGRSSSEIYGADVDCVYEYDGEEWSELHCFERTGGSLASVATCNDRDLWVSSNTRNLIHYRGANGWRDLRTGVDGISDLFCVTGDKVWASGSGQSVLLFER